MTLRQYLDWAKVKPLTFAQQAGISPSVVYRWLSGEFKPNGRNLEKAIRASGGNITVADVFGAGETERKAV